MAIMVAQLSPSHSKERALPQSRDAVRFGQSTSQEVAGVRHKRAPKSVRPTLPSGSIQRKNLLTGITRPLAAFYHLLAWPPSSELDRFNCEVAAARRMKYGGPWNSWPHYY